MGGKKREKRPRAEMIIKAKAAACSLCQGRSYRVPMDQLSCTECGRRRNLNTCPGCGGLPERVEGKECRECGTAAGKNPEFKHPMRSHGTAKMDVF